MQASKIFKNAVAGLVLMIATGAFAANKGSVELSSPVNVAGERLTPGSYTVQWEGDGPTVAVSIMKGKKVVATVPATVEALDTPYSSDSIVVRLQDDGSRDLSQIRFSGKKTALVVQPEDRGAMESNTN